MATFLKYGLTARIYIDMGPNEPDPFIGMYLLTIGKNGPNSAYLITDFHKVKRHDPAAPPRFQLTVQRGHSVEDALKHGALEMHWYPRKKAQNAR